MFLIWLKKQLSLTSSSLFTLFKLPIMSNFFFNIGRDTSNMEALILGNGPGLNDFLTDHKSFSENKSLYAVNFFARTEYYKMLKPENYVIVAPNYWMREDKAEFRESREKTLNTIANDTDWKMTLYVPRIAKGQSKWKEPFKANKNIKIKYFNNTPIEGYKNLKFRLFKWSFGMPRPHNVLIGSIFIALNKRHKKIYITGAEHSWLEGIKVDENNTLWSVQKHFYDDSHKGDQVNNAEAKKVFYLGTNQERRLHDQLEKYYITFKSHWDLQEYSEHLKIPVYNLTLNSWIDAYPKVDLTRKEEN